MKKIIEDVKKNVINMLSNNETVPEKIKVQDIRIFNEAKKRHALEKLILLCNEVKQGLVLKSDFIKARDAIECVICHAEVHFADSLNSEGQCKKCAAEIVKIKKEEEQKVSLLKGWKWLEKELKKFNGAYILLPDGTSNVIKRAVRLSDKTSVVFEIYRSALYSGSTWHRSATDYALVIHSDKSGLKADRLRKDFNGKNVAEGLHNKIEKLISDYEVKTQVRKERKDKNNKLMDMIMKDLGVTEDAIENCYIYPRGRMRAGRVVTNTKEVEFQNIHLKAYISSGKLAYSIGRILKQLTASQVKKIVKLVSTF